jgi:hypothetical protein
MSLTFSWLHVKAFKEETEIFYSFNDYRVSKSFLFCLTDPFGCGFQSCGVQIDTIPWKSQPAFGLYDYPAAIPTAFFSVRILFLLLSPLHRCYMNKAHYLLRTLIFSRKLQSLLDVLDESIDDIDVTYFLFATFRCGICDSTDVGDTDARSSITFDIQCV